MKLTIVGGGGFRVPLVYEAAALGHAGVRVDEIALTDASGSRLATIEAVIRERSQGLADAPRLTATTDARAALEGADFVFTAIRVGDAEGRVTDERIALELGLLGQETIGPGGLAYALRTVPVMVSLARLIAEAAPRAWTINFTNPAGIVTEAMADVLGDRVVGICDTPIGLVNRVARVLGVDPDTVEADYVGINHLGWLRAARVDGTDRLPEVLADNAALDQIEEARVLGFDWVRAIGCLPNEYLYYYRHTARAIDAITSVGVTRGEFLRDQQSRFYDRHWESPATAWHDTLAEREATYMREAHDEARRAEDLLGGGYAGVALRLMAALATGRRERMILNVANAATGSRVVTALPDDVMVEVPVEVDAAGVRPLPVTQPALDQLALMASVRAAEQAIATAALTGNRQEAWRGFSIHPLVNSPTLGQHLLDSYWPA